MNKDLFEELLNEEESSTLDFKRDQYPFAGATNEQKSELLKDILAFANAWRRTDAYILIGVEEIVGGKNKIVGVSNHLSDADLQKFVTSKTNKPLIFSYETITYKKKEVGIIKIPIQERPFFLNKDFGKLKKNVVYIRRNSATDEANPTEIANMAISFIAEQQETPELELQFADIENKISLGNPIDIVSTIIEYDQTKLQRHIESRRFGIFDFRKNPHYEVEMVEFIKETHLLNSIGFTLKNSGSLLVGNIRVEINVKKENGLILLAENEYPDKPTIDRILTTNFSGLLSKVDVEDHSTRWTISVEFGNIQPKATSWSTGVFYIGSSKPYMIKFDALIYADNLSERSPTTSPSRPVPPRPPGRGRGRCACRPASPAPALPPAAFRRSIAASNGS